MAEDRELFRDLLTRIGQPYAPSYIVEGETQELREAEAQGRASSRSACRQSSGPRSRWAAAAAASSRPRTRTGSGPAPACA
jgi:hypothetical protein